MQYIAELYLLYTVQYKTCQKFIAYLIKSEAHDIIELFPLYQ